MPDVRGMINDPQFQGLSLADQQSALSQLDPAFGQLQQADFVRTVQGIRGAKPQVRPVTRAQQLSNIASQPLPHPGFWGSIVNDWRSMSSGNNSIPIYPSRVAAASRTPEQETQAEQQFKQSVQPLEQQAQAAQQYRKQAGYNPLYRALAPAAESVLPVQAAEQSAKTGDVGGVAGHLAPASAAMLAPELLRAVPALARVTEGVAGQVADRAVNIHASPNAAYHAYLDPIQDAPAKLPQMTPRVQNALLNKIAINYPAIATRLRSGSGTLGDLEVARQVAGTAAKAAYSATGRPTEMALGFENANAAIRANLYPAIEQAHGLPQGTIQGFKVSEGSLLNTKPIIPRNQNPIQVLANPVRWPSTAAKTVGKAANYAYQGAKTVAKTASLPEPTAYEPPPPFVPRQLPQYSGPGNWAAYAVDQMSKDEQIAALKQMLRSTPQKALPVASGIEIRGAIRLKAGDIEGMTAGERRAALIHFLRNQSRQPLLPEKVQAIPLGSSSLF